jgi:hypothetical protein
VTKSATKPATRAADPGGKVPPLNRLAFVGDLSDCRAGRLPSEYEQPERITRAPQGPGLATIVLHERVGPDVGAKSSQRCDTVGLPIPSDGTLRIPRKIESPPRIGRKRAALMKYVHGTWICPTCGSSRIAAVSKALQCEICSGGMRRQSARRKVGEVLRRWTADAASSMGRQVPSRASFADPLVADVRRLQLGAVASKLAAARVPRVAEGGKWDAPWNTL